MAMLALAIAFSAAAQQSKVKIPSAQKPLNILLFTADDLDRNSLGCFGSTVPDISPNIDRFATQSIRFEKAFVNAAICVPSRAIIATAMYDNTGPINRFDKMKECSSITLIIKII